MLTFIASLGDFLEPTEVVAVKALATDAGTKEMFVYLKTTVLRYFWIDAASFRLIGEEIRAAQEAEFKNGFERSTALAKAVLES